MDVVDTLDTIGSTAGNIPRGTKRVLAYITGSQGIAWTPDQLAAHARQGEKILRIDQSNRIAPYRTITTLIKDIEPGASSIGAAVAEAEDRARVGLRTCFYMSLSDWTAVRLAVHGQLADSIDYLVADWTGSRAAAVAFIANHLRDGVIGVQYASPSSNPELRIPGSRRTLAQANVDLSVTLADWPTPRPAPKPSRKPKRKVAAGGSAGALATVIIAILHQAGATPTPAEASAITLVVTMLAAYLTPAGT